jgi:glyoxylase-like metal-dependent hydrolase (beta-lactamase superfamily II)
MKKSLFISLVTLSFLSANQTFNSAQIMEDAFAQLEAIATQVVTKPLVVETLKNNNMTDINKSISSGFTLGKYGTFKFEKMNDNVHVMHGPVVSPNKENQGFMNNPAVIEGEHGLIVVDPGGNYNVGKKILAEIEKVSKKPIVAVFNTHKHGDHWFANKAIVEKYPNVNIYAHPHMIKVVKEGEAEVWYAILSRGTGNLEGTKAFAFPTTPLNHLDEIEVDGQKFVVGHPTVAHTDTDLVIFHKNSKTLFLGDNLMKGRLGSFDESSSVFGNIELLKKIKESNSLTLYVPGHGFSGKKDETIDPFLDYLNILAVEGQKAYDEDLESYEIKNEVMTKLPWMKDWDGFAKNMPSHLNKIMIEMGERELNEEEDEE